MKITVFKTPKPRRFMHKPIYWNPEEDERKERQERVRKQMGEILAEGEEFKTSISRGSFRKATIGVDAPMRDDSYHSEKRRSNVRLLIIIVGLLAVAAMMYLTSSDYLAL